MNWQNIIAKLANTPLLGVLLKKAFEIGYVGTHLPEIEARDSAEEAWKAKEAAWIAKDQANEHALDTLRAQLAAGIHDREALQASLSARDLQITQQTTLVAQANDKLKAAYDVINAKEAAVRASSSSDALRGDL
jgi:ATP-dependent protease HslVU (ClpYQ) ATPase subunit